METTALSTTRPGGALTEVEQLIAEEMQRDENAYVYQPVRYRIASQVGMFQNILDEEDTARQMDGIILMSRICRAFWPNRAGGAEEDRRPRCSSKDGITGQWRTDDERFILRKCIGCEMNEWGSEVKPTGQPGRAKACKEMRRFLVLRAGYDVPVVLTIPPTSCKGFDQYASVLRTKRSAYFAVETVVGLERAESVDGHRYSVATFRPNGGLDKEMVTWVRSLRRQFEEALGVAPEYEEYYDNGHNPDDPDRSWSDDDAPWPGGATD